MPAKAGMVRAGMTIFDPRSMNENDKHPRLPSHAISSFPGGEVLPEWIDYNGHMNLAYYIVLFDQATDALFDCSISGSNTAAAVNSAPLSRRRTPGTSANCWSARRCG